MDVDGTLIQRGKLNKKLVQWIIQKRAEGFSFVLWSTRGQDHAKLSANTFGIAHLFDAILGKPGYIVDDKGWQWTKYVKRVRL